MTPTMHRRQFLATSATLAVTTPDALKPTDPTPSEAEICSDVYHNHVLPARRHLTTTHGDGAAAAKAELEAAIEQLDTYLDATQS